MEFNFFERYLLIFKTDSSPNLPVNAFAFPELTTMALTVACSEELKLLLHRFTGALDVRDLVKTPAIEHDLSNSTSRRSSSLSGVFFIPQKVVKTFMPFR